jgi:NAD(P)-dependent dehydrogenase (short-subunit alcohol dehydrogenase family)
MPTRRKPDHRVAFVTGGASGIGLATAELLLGSGWKVAIADADQKALDVVHGAHSDSKDVYIAQLDVTDEAAVDAAVAAAAKKLGPIDGVVNSAGVARDVPALDTPADVFRRILDVNVTGSFLVARAAARLMRERHAKSGIGGAIVNLASVSGLRGSKGRVAYGASKGAVVTMTQVLANDLSRYGIRVNAVAPGPVESPMVKTVHTPSDRALWMRHVPLNRYGEPHEIATAIEFLLDGTRSSYITAEILAVDGGFRGAGLIADRN